MATGDNAGSFAAYFRALAPSSVVCVGVLGLLMKAYLHRIVSVRPLLSLLVLMSSLRDRERAALVYCR